MASSTLSFLPESHHRGNVDPLIHNISNYPVANMSSSKMTQDSPKKNSHHVVQYRRSGQYYRFSPESDRANQAMPTRYIAERSIAEPEPEPEPAATDAHVIDLTTEECLEEETDEGMREWLLECSRQERELLEKYSTFEDYNDDAQVYSLQEEEDDTVGANRVFEAPCIEINSSSEEEDDYSHLADNEEDEAIPFQETLAVASTSSKDERRDDQSTQRESVVQALRKLYEPGRRLRRRLENKTEERDPNDAQQEPPVVVVTPTKLRASTLSRTKPSDTANAPSADANICDTQDEVHHQEDDEDDDEDFYNYYNGDTSEFYSDDLVVEWGSTQSYEEMISNDEQPQTKHNDHSSGAPSQSSFAAVSRRAMGKKHRKRVLFDVYGE